MSTTTAFPAIERVALRAWRESGVYGDFRGHRVFAQIAAIQANDELPWLLLIHGFPTASLDWYPLWAKLSQHFRLLAPDLLGFGFSAKPTDHDYRIAEQADLLEFWCRKFGIAQHHVLAHDYGVTVAQELLARDGEQRARGECTRIASIAFLNGGLFPETHRPRLIQKLLLTPLGPLLSRLLTERSFARSFSAVFGPKTQPASEELAAFWQLIAEQHGQRIAHRLMRYVPERHVMRERWVRALIEAPIPKRLINGALDPVSGRHLAERYRELVPAADVVSLEDIGHYPQVEAPARVYAALREFWITNAAIKESSIKDPA